MNIIPFHVGEAVLDKSLGLSHSVSIPYGGKQRETLHGSRLWRAGKKGAGWILTLDVWSFSIALPTHIPKEQMGGQLYTQMPKNKSSHYSILFL
jgi:hypothetical protein